MKKVTALFFQYSGGCFIILSLIYGFLKLTRFTIYGEAGIVFGALFRMFMYHEEHPLQYLLLVALCYGVLATLWARFLGTKKGWQRQLSIMGVLGLTVFGSSMPGGVLWVLHDMQAGFFPEGQQFWDDLLWGAVTGLQVGWLIFLLSIPYNLLCVIAGYWFTGYIAKRR